MGYFRENLRLKHRSSLKALKVQRNEKKVFGEVNISFYVYIMDYTDTDL